MKETSAFLSFILFVAIAAAAPKAVTTPETPDQKLTRLKDDLTSGLTTGKALRTKIATGKKVKRAEVQAMATILDTSIQEYKVTSEDSLNSAIKERDRLNQILSEEGDPTP